MDDSFLADFRRTIHEAVDDLLAYSDADASRLPGPGKWSKKEIIGHLIDSAAHNHARFVRAQLQEDLVFDGYDQARWVEVQRYRDRPWADLVRFWQAYNSHLASVMETADVAAVARPRARHNLDEVALQGVRRTEPTTLDYFMRDYVAHLKHHLRQALPDDSNARPAGMTGAPDQRLLEAVLDSWDRNNTILLNLLRALPEGGLEARAMAGSPSIAQLFTHIHFVRLVFVFEDAPEFARDVPGDEWVVERDRGRIAHMLNDSAKAVRDAVHSRVEAGQDMNLHYDHPILLLQHMLWHEGYHHGQMKLALKVAGRPMTDDEAGPITWGVWMRSRR